jgi:hypothetical protein
MKHKHYDMIVAWAEGRTIQNFNDRKMRWEDITGDPYWVSSFQYRIKPEPKPDLKLYFEVAKYTSEKDKPFLFLHRECMNPENNRIDSISQNLRLIFDGETGELKSAEVLK